MTEQILRAISLSHRIIESHPSFMLHPILFIKEVIIKMTANVCRICHISLPAIVYVPALNSGFEKDSYIGVDKTTQFL